MTARRSGTVRSRRPGRSEAPRTGRLLELIGLFDRTPVAVLGDYVLDEFVSGEIARVSREAPVLILQHRSTSAAPGGAGNAAANLAALGARPIAIGRIGRDADAVRLSGLLEERGVDVSGLVRDPACVTPVKSRVLAGSAHTAKQQIVRIDRGAPGPPSESVQARIARKLAAARRRAAGLLIADYGYGAVDPKHTELRRWIRERGATVGLDSRFRLLEFSGVTAATPNISELEAALGVRIADDDLGALERAASRLRKKLGAETLVVTRGSRGMSVFAEGGPPSHLPVFGTDQVADVTGAGDTVAATFLLGLLAGGTPTEAAVLANTAGGLVVTKRGTATVSPAELSRAVSEEA